jgi:hypothetical protein
MPPREKIPFLKTVLPFSGRPCIQCPHAAMQEPLLDETPFIFLGGRMPFAVWRTCVCRAG